ncbi:uncharacterized protein DNG_09873 [Cephalotrichum gorgonifer]|uniref:Uncharacterized protein n=1 Tax=Cephalotrichum gorgonifer TaxID=2041049 RepID=A0AAE8N7L2_9PEZI|nr:uncharacterized protein DNG_09873 [Cephalotrichum gorgonifer]
MKYSIVLSLAAALPLAMAPSLHAD